MTRLACCLLVGLAGVASALLKPTATTADVPPPFPTEHPWEPAKYNYSYKWHSDVPVDGNVTLGMDCVIPTLDKDKDKELPLMPVVVFPNSWGVPQIEYAPILDILVPRGYVACEYAARGWWSSNGTIGLAGPQDRKDTTTIIHWIQKQSRVNGGKWPVNVSNFAFAGISYGAGLSLMAAGANPELVKTAVAMSGWGMLHEGFYYHNSPCNSSMYGLLEMANWTGHPGASLDTFYDWVTHDEHMRQVWEFCHSRSPELVDIPVYRKHNTPIFLSNNMQDHFFFPQGKMEFFNKLPGPKFQLINQGGHGVPEGMPIINFGKGFNFIWHKAHLWLDYWLKGHKDNGIMEEAPVQIQDSESIYELRYVKMKHWGDSDVVTSRRVYMSPQPAVGQFKVKGTGSMSSVPPSGLKDKDKSAMIQYQPGAESHSLMMGWGLAEIGSEKYGLPDPCYFAESFKEGYNLLYNTDPFPFNTTLCGIINFTLTVTVPKTRMWQMFAILYEFNADPLAPFGNILGEFEVTYWGDYNTVNSTSTIINPSDIKPGPTPDTEVVTIRNLNARTICHNFKAGTAFSVGFVLKNHHFVPAAKDGLQVALNYGEETFLDLPFVINPQW